MPPRVQSCSVSRCANHSRNFMAASVSGRRYAMKSRKSCHKAPVRGTGCRPRPRDRRTRMPRDGVPQQCHPFIDLRNSTPRCGVTIRKSAGSCWSTTDSSIRRHGIAPLPMTEARMRARRGARRRTPCGRCAVVVLQMKAASALSEEAGLPGRETVCA